MDDSSSDAPTEAAIRRRTSKNRQAPSAVSILSDGEFRHEPTDFSSVAVLSGRETQELALRGAYARVSSDETEGSSEVVLIHGLSGTGKSALVESIRGLVTENDTGFIVSGKFDQLVTRQAPFSAIAEAFSDICDLILQSGPAEARKQSISEALDGSDSLVLSRVISSIASLSKRRDDFERAEEEADAGTRRNLSAPVDAEAFPRFALACRHFLSAVATAEHRLVILFDDLQWADEMSIELIKSFINDAESRHVLFCVAYRDDEIDGKALLGITDENTDSGSLPSTDIAVTNLDTDAMRSMLAPLLHMHRDSVCGLASLLFEKTKGNPHAVVQLLQHLKTKELLTFSDETYSWEWDMHSIESEVSDNPAEIIADKVGRLRPEEQEALKMAAFLGNSFDAELLNFILNPGQQDMAVNLTNPPLGASSTVCREAKSLTYLQDSVKVGLIKENGVGHYRFTHDSIQHFVYNSVGAEPEQALIHLEIGRRLISLLRDIYSIKDSEGDAWLLLAASNLVRGANHIESDDERIATIQLLLKAATAAISKASIINAKPYVDCAVVMLKKSDYETNFELCIDLQNTYAEVSYCTGNFENSDKAIEIVLRDATREKDKFRAKCTKMNSFISQKSLEKTIDWVFNVVLRDLGERIPTKPSIAQVVFELTTVKAVLWKMGPEGFLSLPTMADERRLAAMRVFNKVSPVLFSSPAHRLLYLYCTLRQIRLSAKHGVSSFTSTALVAYAVLLVATNKYEKAYELEKVTTELSSREGFSFSARSLCLATTYLFINPLRQPLGTILKPMLESYKIGLMSGSDSYIACYGLFVYLSARMELGAHIKELEEELRRYCRQMKELQANQVLSYVRVLWQYTLNLLGRSDDPLILTGEAMDQDKLRSSLQSSPYTRALETVHGYDLRLQLSFEDWDSIVQTLPLVAEDLTGAVAGFIGFFRTADVALASLAMYERTEEKIYRKIAKKATKTMAKWSNQQVPDVGPLMKLIDAEWKATFGKDTTAESYEVAIAALRASGFAAFEMLAYQRAMHLMIRQSEMRKAAEFLTRSKQRHREWGNVAKVEWLEVEYSDVSSFVKPMYVVEVTMPPRKSEEELCLMNIR